MSDWHPIETAPDDCVVLVFDEGYIGTALRWKDKWVDASGEMCDRRDQDGAFDPPPTHWMPLPAPPVTHE